MTSFHEQMDDSERFGEPEPMAICALCNEKYWPKESRATAFLHYCSIACEREDQIARCSQCGSTEWIYKGDRQVCAECGR